MHAPLPTCTPQPDQLSFTNIPVDQHYIKRAQDSFVCMLCHKDCKRPSQIRQHIRLVHLKERKHRCSFCDASFGLKGHRTSHEKICKAKPK